MYKLIIGNVRVTVMGDGIGRDKATAAARQAIMSAAKQGKLLQHVEISEGPEGIEVRTLERACAKLARKTVKQSMLDGIMAAVTEKLTPASMFSGKDTWFDGDTGQEWVGEDVRIAREEILKKLEEWTKTV